MLGAKIIFHTIENCYSTDILSFNKRCQSKLDERNLTMSHGKKTSVFKVVKMKILYKLLTRCLESLKRFWIISQLCPFSFKG